jgi:hypothetical protein
VDNAFPDGFHNVLTLKQRAQDGKHRYDQNRTPKGQQAGSHGRADAVGRVIGSGIPTDVGAGGQQDQQLRFDGDLRITTSRAGLPPGTGRLGVVQNLLVALSTGEIHHL